LLLVFAYSFWVTVAGLLPTVLIVLMPDGKVWPFDHLTILSGKAISR